MAGVNEMNGAEGREYGGFLPLDFNGEEYYAENRGYELLRCNGARYAIAEAFKDSGCRRMFIPTYTCRSVPDALDRAHIPYTFYAIDSGFRPLVSGVREDECLLVTNYYGILKEELIAEWTEKYKYVILDNTQCFFQRPVLREGVYNIYSPRKFVGVTDGAYGITLRFRQKHEMKPDYSYERAGYLLQSTECGTNAAYASHLRAEKALANSGPRAMSGLTRALLKRIDYQDIIARRKDNFLCLCEIFEGENELDVSRDVFSPMVYPFMTRKKRGTLREYLVRNRIYVPQWWKWVLDREGTNAVERELSQWVYPLPIDQRYGREDMNRMAEVVLGGLDTLSHGPGTAGE